jgi:hypothetical protein
MSNATDVYGLPMSKGSKLQELVRLQRAIERLIDEEKIGWIITHSQFWVLRSEAGKAPKQFMEWATSVLEDLEENAMEGGYPTIETMVRELYAQARVYDERLTSNHDQLNGIAAAFVKLAGGRMHHLSKVLEIAEASVLEAQPLSVAAQRYYELLETLEAEERKSLTLFSTVDHPLDPKVVLELRAALAELELHLALDETSEAPQ